MVQFNSFGGFHFQIHPKKGHFHKKNGLSNNLKTINNFLISRNSNPNHFSY